MSEKRIKNVPLKRNGDALVDHSAKGKTVDHIRFSKADSSTVYINIAFTDQSLWSLSLDSFLMPIGRVMHFDSIEDDAVADSGLVFLPYESDEYPQWEHIQQLPKPSKKHRQ